MEILFDKKSPTDALVTVKIKEEDYRNSVEEKIREYGKKVNLKGFRPGKVPHGLIRKMYGRDIVADEVNNLVSESVAKYIREQNLNIIGRPLPSIDAPHFDPEANSDFDFTFDIGFIPEFELPSLSAAKFTGYKIQADESTVNETIENLKKRHAKSIKKDMIEEGDYVQGMLRSVSEADDFEKQVFLPLVRIKEEQVKSLLGLTAGQKVEFDIQQLFENTKDLSMGLGVSEEQAAGLSGKFELEVAEVTGTELPEENQDFFDKVFGKDSVTDVSEFRSKVKEDINKSLEEESEKFLHAEIEKFYVENASIEVSETFLKRWLLLVNEGKLTEESIGEEMDRIVKSVKWSAVKSKLASEYGLAVSGEEIEEYTRAKYRSMMKSWGIAEPSEEMVNNFATEFLRKNRGENYESTYEEMMQAKLFNAVKEKANIREETISLKDFSEKVKKSN